MNLAATFLLILGTASAFAPLSPSPRQSVAVSETQADLKELGVKLNPVVNFFDPINLSETNFWDQGEEASIGWLRQAEIKHGRVAMMAFAGYCVQSNWHWPWAMTTAGDPFPSTDLSPEQQWDAIPEAAKWQIIVLAGAFEVWDETVGLREGEGSHYMRGGRPGDYPSFSRFREDVHFVFDLYDPFGFNKKMSEEKKETRLAMEINNGRLAMLGIFGFLAADKVPGSVPLLDSWGVTIPYEGATMAPFASDFSLFGN
mmetsp:Transcript_49520/g.96871  ORF Transcript_49520/g.96871 Transcript_49520/m.96871 type:complete len:257 (-) Transcript_49520:305-1075(-)|eukprot:CAMPEP_0194304308 /NCGR_PEP_ID=MMETSP0171-20130528/2081_1 /TAXON_ID=218684 /ORGANISM="Corethron pennatum, Strain L29A3" /LENGTH=256 /DNA_ID=CAMNT_0039055543 /DNA_START=166 /DNA_END=936 /DNA_ORIENTATION=-